MSKVTSLSRECWTWEWSPKWPENRVLYTLQKLVTYPRSGCPSLGNSECLALPGVSQTPSPGGLSKPSVSPGFVTQWRWGGGL